MNAAAPNEVLEEEGKESAGPAALRIEPRDAVEMVTALRKEIVELKERAWMADACLNQIRDWLIAHGLDVTHVPPMYYPEACQAVLARQKRRGLEEVAAASSAKDQDRSWHDNHDYDRWREG